jgi:hypothetical protein
MTIHGDSQAPSRWCLGVTCLFLYHLNTIIIIIIIIITAVLGLELRAYTLSHSTSPFFVMRFFKIGSLELFTPAGFEP